MIANVQIETDLLYAKQLPAKNGYTWTLASRLGHILRIAEQFYGPRDTSYTILGVEFGGAVPQIWFPGACRHIVVQITPQCATDMQRACYQMAHESIHLLSPTGIANANTLEEGLAAHFSSRYMLDHFQAVWDNGPGPYQTACQHIVQLLALDEGIIRTLRQTEPTLSAVTVEQIRAAHADVAAELATALTQPFR
jgi:hypothetical protein